MSARAAVHFIGISGIGMSGLARILLQRGATVSGSSDRRTALTDRLAGEGARIHVGHAPDNLGDAATVIVSTAIDARNPELVAARESGREVVHRGELLARLMAERRGIAIAGTHGKTTTTAMTATILERAGLDPSVVVGGERADGERNARDGRGLWFLAEADESDGSFLRLRPEIAVVTNIENDHIENDAQLPQLIQAFDDFLRNVPVQGLAVVGVDEARARALAAQPRAARTTTYGLHEGAELRATDLRPLPFGTEFTVVRGGERLGVVRLRVPGAINVQNALAASAVALELGVSFDAVARALETFAGVRRRFEFLLRSPRLCVVDDYAHHPTAVAATLAAARESFSGPIVAVFQPHRFSRTQYLAADFARALRGADRVVLTDIYAASEAPLAGVDARCIGEPLAASGVAVDYVALADVPRRVAELAPYGALVLMLGAGSITSAAAQLAEHVRDSERAHPHAGGPSPSVLAARDVQTLSELFGARAKFDEPLAPYTSWKIGGPADVLLEVRDAAELGTLLAYVGKRRLPWFVLGSGSNLLVGDGGIRGVVIRLRDAFQRIEIEEREDVVDVRAGASASLALLTAQAAGHGAAGISSLAGIPGSVGGALRMNAGTDREMGDFVRDVFVQTPSRPGPHAVSPQYFYRHTTLARDAIVESVRLEFPRGPVGEVRAEMQARLVRRKATQPLQFPSAGSCFRNPPGDKAGRLLEAAGAKGLRVGDAEVSDLHANFIVNRGAATAADVAAVLARARRLVAERFAVELELEVHFVGVFV